MRGIDRNIFNKCKSKKNPPLRQRELCPRIDPVSPGGNGRRRGVFSKILKKYAAHWRNVSAKKEEAMWYVGLQVARGGGGGLSSY
jgi:hypothetical protein